VDKSRSRYASKKERHTMTRPRKTYFPSKTFDDQLAALVALFASKGWAFAGVDNQQLASDVEAQRTERGTHDALELQYRNAHESFGVAQEKRFERFAAALAAARGAFRDNKAILAELARFTRVARRTSTEEPPEK